MPNVMKNSGFQWIGDIPQNWEMRRVKWCFCQKKEKAGIEDPTVLSLARDGIKVRDISTNEGQLAADYTNYNPVEPGDLLLNPMDLYSGDNCNISKISGVISPAYVNLKTINGNIPEFYNYYFKTQYWTMAFFAHGKGVSFENRWTLTNETLRNYPVVLPNPTQQKKIADYLDDKCGKIDQAIEGQKKIIEKLKEYKQSVITEAVTKGLDPNVPMKDSGIEWIGQIPEPWEIVKLKTKFSFGKGLNITKENLTETGIPVISYGQIHSKTNNGIEINDSLIRYVSETYLKENPNSLVNRGDFIIADTSEDLEGVGNSILIDRQMNLFAGYHSLILKRKKEDFIFSKYLAYLMQSDCWRSQLRCQVMGIKLFSITKKMLNSATIVIPPQKEQELIVNYLDLQRSKIEDAILQKQETIEKLTEYKKSLIYECVTGKKEIV